MALPSNKHLHIDDKNVLKQVRADVLQAYQNGEDGAEEGLGGGKA